MHARRNGGATGGFPAAMAPKRHRAGDAGPHLGHGPRAAPLPPHGPGLRGGGRGKPGAGTAGENTRARGPSPAPGRGVGAGQRGRPGGYTPRFPCWAGPGDVGFHRHTGVRPPTSMSPLIATVAVPEAPGASRGRLPAAGHVGREQGSAAGTTAPRDNGPCRRRRGSCRGTPETRPATRGPLPQPPSAAAPAPRWGTPGTGRGSQPGRSFPGGRRAPGASPAEAPDNAEGCGRR